MISSDHPGAFVTLRALVELGLRDAVISPGSRNAPLIMAAHSLPNLRLTVALDERSAAHIALGMSIANRRPAAVLCTSGTAAINHGPAIAEAHYQRVPLISISADRPVNSRGKGWGQTVRQARLFESHAILELELDETVLSEEDLIKDVQHAWRAAQFGPVHLNVPMNEPLYETTTWPNSDISMREESLFPATHDPDAFPSKLLDLCSVHEPRILLLLGMAGPWSTRFAHTEELNSRMAVLSDAFAPIRSDDWECSADRFMAAHCGHIPLELMPDVVITVGLPPMSKALRKALAGQAISHWHVGDDGSAWDIFGALDGHWEIDPEAGIEALAESLPMGNGFASNWQVAVDRVQVAQRNIRKSREWPWSDWTALETVSKMMGEVHAVHFANSTAARYAQLFGWNASRLHANRGVSGIDGCTSTAIGDAIMHPEKTVVLISGDAAWLYDLNGLHVRPFPSNFKAIVVNNGGGNIFRWLDGPERHDLLETYFEAPMCSNMQHTALLSGMDYFEASTEQALHMALERWRNNDTPSLLEIKTNGRMAAETHRKMMDGIALYVSETHSSLEY